MAAWRSSKLTGSARSAGGSWTAWLSLGTAVRAGLPRLARSAGLSRRAAESRPDFRPEPGGTRPVVAVTNRT